MSIYNLNIATDLPANQESHQPFNAFINYVFWILLIFYTDPGGIVEALGLYYVSGKVNLTDLLFVLLTGCYLIYPKNHTVFDLDYLKIRKYLLIFLAYFMIVYVVAVPFFNGIKEFSMMTNLIKSRYTVYNILSSIYAYEFFKTRWDVFLKIFLSSSIIVLILFIITVLTGKHLLPIGLMNRDYININRNLMVSEGIMPLLIPLGAVILVFRIKIRFKYLILAGYALMSIAYVLELWRRNIAAIFIYFLLAVLADLFITKRFSVLINNAVKITVLLAVVTLASYILFPKYVNAAFIGIEKSFSVVEGQTTVEGEKDVRMTLDRPFINELFYKYPLFGTGFDNRWRTKGGDDQGYEAADYPFLAALAMFGISGLLIFLPIYLVIIKLVKLDFEYLRINKNAVTRSFYFLFLVSFLLYFAFDFLQYFNYFQGASNSESSYWYFVVTLFLAARARFYTFELGKNNLELAHT